MQIVKKNRKSYREKTVKLPYSEHACIQATHDYIAWLYYNRRTDQTKTKVLSQCDETVYRLYTLQVCSTVCIVRADG